MSYTIQLLGITSRFALAVAIAYFAYQLARVVDNLPLIEQSLTQVSQQVPPTLEEIAQVRLEIAEVRKLVPEVLTETAAVRQQIPVILQEVKKVRNTIPSVVSEAAAIRQQTSQVLITADRGINSFNKAQQQIDTLLPPVLTEIQLTREKIDPTLDRVDGMIEKAHSRLQDTLSRAEGAGQEASEGAITGILSGIFKLPFRLVGTLASPILEHIEPDVTRQLTLNDIELMGEAGKRASESAKLDQVHRWENADSGNSGSITLLRRFKSDEADCVEVHITINNQDQSILDKHESYCRSKDGDWELTQNRN